MQTWMLGSEQKRIGAREPRFLSMRGYGIVTNNSAQYRLMSEQRIPHMS